jgi:hypothetical protein
MSQQRPPILQAPIYLSGAEPPQAVIDVCRKAKPLAGLLGATALGATAAYFAPKFWDFVLARWRERDLVEGDDGED